MLLLLLLIAFLHTQMSVSEMLTSDTSAEKDWDSVTSLSAEEIDRDLMPPAFKAGPAFKAKTPVLKLPESLRISASQLHKALFVPGRYAGPVPKEVRDMLVPSGVPAVPSTGVRSKLMEVQCHLDRMYVRVRTSLILNVNDWKHLKLGTCSVNKVTATHYYFLYNLKSCGVTRAEDRNRVTYTNRLTFRPPHLGPIVRTLPFTVPVRCSYTKFHRSYQVGFWPAVRGETVYRGLHTHGAPSLTTMDESWKLLPEGTSFTLGQSICLEAVSPMRRNNRLYVNTCFVTSNPSPAAAERYVVLGNNGCLLDSKHSTVTTFHPTKDKTTVRLCFAAFLFKGMVSEKKTQQSMFMHCEMYLGPEDPSPSAKACTYNIKTSKWTELYGPASVCDCCASTCPANATSSGKSVVTSKSWNLKMGKDSMSKFSVSV